MGEMQKEVTSVRFKLDSKNIRFLQEAAVCKVLSRVSRSRIRGLTQARVHGSPSSTTLQELLLSIRHG